MKYVVDSSVALKWVLPEPDSGKAIRLWHEYISAQHELIAPDVFAPEVANGLVSAERQGRIRSGEAALLFQAIIRAAPSVFSTQIVLLRAMEISLSTRQAVYDCAYLALAEAETCALVSADDQFVRKVRPAFPLIIRLADLP